MKTVKTHQTQVGIIGAGPAGLLLAQMLHNRGIDAIVIESRPREHVRTRLRAGIQEQGTVDTFVAEGVGANLQKSGLVHKGMYVHFNDQSYYLNGLEMTGKQVVAYGQRNIVCDMIDIRETKGLPLFFNAQALRLENFEEPAPQQTKTKAKIYFSYEDAERCIECDFIVGCDGFHGISRAHIPEKIQKVYQKVFPYSWFGILAEAPPKVDEVIYAHSPYGFALQSMRGPQKSRLYLQVPPNENIERWSDTAFFDEFEKRIGAGYKVNRGKIVERSLAQMRSFVLDPMQYGNLYLAGDAAHIVPPTGAKGLNLAVADVRVLGAALHEYYAHGKKTLLKCYSETCLSRIWIVQRFSWMFTINTHKPPDADEYDFKIQLATLHYHVSSQAGRCSLVENYVGLPYDDKLTKP